MQLLNEKMELLINILNNKIKTGVVFCESSNYRTIGN